MLSTRELKRSNFVRLGTNYQYNFFASGITAATLLVLFWVCLVTDKCDEEVSFKREIPCSRFIYKYIESSIDILLQIVVSVGDISLDCFERGLSTFSKSKNSTLEIEVFTILRFRSIKTFWEFQQMFLPRLSVLFSLLYAKFRQMYTIYLLLYSTVPHLIFFRFFFHQEIN